MKSQNLILIIIILVYVVSVILKRVRAASKAGAKGTAKRRPEWKEKLDKYMTRVRQELEIAGQEDSGEESGWAEVLPREDDQPEHAMQGTEAMVISPQPARKAVRSAVAERIKPPVSAKEVRPESLAYGIQDLRKAVIWSEILAPPLALRGK